MTKVPGKFTPNLLLVSRTTKPSDYSFPQGFYDDCKRRYSIKLWKTFTDCFNCLPVSALVEDKILCMHGGLSVGIPVMIVSLISWMFLRFYPPRGCPL